MGAHRLLLRLYPASFRGLYGDEMGTIFARRRRQAQGPLAVAGLWSETALEVIGNAAAAHWDLLRQDLRYTVRTLGRSPGFTATALVVVALGIGANTAVFSVTDYVLVRRLPFRQPERLVKLWEDRPGYSQMEPSPANYRDWKAMSRTFSAMGAFDRRVAANLVGRGEPVRLQGAAVTADVLPLLGARPLAGRLFTAAEDRPGAGGTLILSDRLWRTEFGGELSALGRKVTLDGTPFVIIGILPADFRFPERGTDFWRPEQLGAEDFADRTDNRLEVVARLRGGVDIEAARAEMAVVAARLARQYPREDARTGAAVVGLRDELSRQTRLLLVALAGAALCVLAIACANLAALLVARAMAREHELQVRAALGAGRERLVRQMATESLVLALAGGALGLLVALAALPLLTRLVPAALPVAEAPGIDLRALLFASLLTAATGLGLGIVPALRLGRQAHLAGLKESARAGGGRRERLRTALVMVEIAATVVLLVSAGLFIGALWRLQSTDPGFRPQGVLTLRTALPSPKYRTNASRVRFYDRVLAEVRALPGVRAAAYASGLPMVWGGGIWPVAIDGAVREAEGPREGSQVASLRFVTPGYLATLGIPLRRGREVAASDTLHQPYVAVVSESFVRRFWPDRDPLGRHLQVAYHDRVVVGVAGDVRVRGFERTSEPQVYLPYQQQPDGQLFYYAPKDLAVRSTAAAEALLPPIRRILRAADPEQPLSDIRTMEEIVDDETSPRATQVRVLGAFAAIAALLAGTGIHGLLAFAVSQRAREIGVRRALGARSADILSAVLRHGVLTAAAGLVPGLLLAYAGGRAMEALLAGVQPADPATFTAAAVLCLLMTISGCIAPALRAVRVDPMTVVRSE